jgi:hypothetical protein
LKEIDYVRLYAERLREDNGLFEQQKRFLDGQYAASRSLFKNMFRKGFKRGARAYLRGRGLIE